ncbi:MAG: DUF2750 domain-containing protein [Burkholderiales bacterium]
MDFKFVLQQYPRYRDVGPKQLAAVMKLTPDQRYEHFIKEICRQEQVCGLCMRDHWAMTRLHDGNHAFLFWPAAQYAKSYLWPDANQIHELGGDPEHYDYDAQYDEYTRKELAGFVPRFIELGEFMEILLPQLKQNNILPGVFFTPFENGIIPAVDELAQRVDEHYMEWYSDEPKPGSWETKRFNAWCRKVEPKDSSLHPDDN